MSRLIQFRRAANKSGTKATPWRIVPRLICLEDRLAPIVGAFAEPAAIAPIPAPQPASQYDGVVRRGGGSGSLIATGAGWARGHHILTVAHGIDLGGAMPVTFDLQRGGNPVQIVINAPANVAGGAQYQVRHSAYAGFKNDIGLVVLPDQVTPAPNRLLVAPFTAQQYQLYGGAPAEVGQDFTMVGYGLTGTGAAGHNKAGGVKRAGQNRFDSDALPWDKARPMALMYDFDRLNDPGKLADIDPIGALYGIANAGLGAAEAFHAPGDSGGPAFVGKNLIAGVMASIASPGMPPDINAATDGTFGELGFITNVSMTIGDAALQAVLSPGGGATYDLVLDMQQQIYGRSGALGPGGVGPPAPDTISIRAKNVGGNLELWVNGPDAALNGRYYSAPANQIKSLTIRGSDDDSEWITIEGPLGLVGTKEVTLVGRGANDKFYIERLDGPGANDFFGTITVEGGAGDDYLSVNDTLSETNNTYEITKSSVTRTGRAPVNYTSIQELRFFAGSKADIINVVSVSADTTNFVYIDGGPGRDEIMVGGLNATGLDEIKTKVFVTGGIDSGHLYLTDTPTAAGRTYNWDKSDVAGWDTKIHRTDVSPVYGSFIDEYTLSSSDKNDEINVLATTGTATKGNHVLANGGDDKITIGSTTDGLANIATKVSVQGGGGKNKLTLDNQAVKANSNYTVEWDSFKYGNFLLIDEYINVDDFILKSGPGDDVVEAKSESNVTNYEYKMGGGNDVVRRQNNMARLDDLLSPLAAVFGEDGIDRLEFTDSGYLNGETYTVRAAQVEVARLPGVCTFDSVENLDLYAGIASDTVKFDGVVAAVHFTVDAGGYYYPPSGDYDKLMMLAGYAYNPYLWGFERLDITDGTLELIDMGMAVLDMTQTGGTLDGPATVSASKSLLWTGGVMQGTGRTESLDTSTATITRPVTLNTRRFVNAGGGTWTNNIGGGGGTLENAWTGTLDTVGNVSISGNLENSGLLRPGKAGSIGRITVSDHFSNGGILAVDLGPGGDASDQVVAQTTSIGGELAPSAVGGFPDKFYNVVIDQSVTGSGWFWNAYQGAILTISGVKYMMRYEDDPYSWGKAVLRAVVDVGDEVWEDRNLNGLHETWIPPSYQYPYGQGDPPMSGIEVRLHKAGGELVSTTYTGSDGKYLFPNVLVDDYYLVFIRPDPDWWRFTLKDAGSDTIDSDADRSSGATDVFTLYPGIDDPTRDAGMYRLATIGDWVWHDYYIGGDGIQNDGGGGFEGLTVTLLNAQGGVVQTTTTGYNGSYSFSKIEQRDANWVPIQYRVQFTKPPNYYGQGYSVTYAFSPKDAGPDHLDSDANPGNGQTDLYTLNQSGEYNWTIDCGIQQSMTSGGQYSGYSAFQFGDKPRDDRIASPRPIAPDFGNDSLVLPPSNQSAGTARSTVPKDDSATQSDQSVTTMSPESPLAATGGILPSVAPDFDDDEVWFARDGLNDIYVG